MTITLDIGQTLSFSPSAVSVKQGDNISINCANMALKTLGSGWTWYVDGSPVSGQTSSLLSINTSPYSVGQHIVSCVVTYNGANYSGYLNVTVTQ